MSDWRVSPPPLATSCQLIKFFVLGGRTVKYAGGSYDSFVESAEHGGKSGPLDYYLIQSYRTANGHRANAGGELQDYLGRIGYDINENWNLSVLFNLTDNSARGSR